MRPNAVFWVLATVAVSEALNARPGVALTCAEEVTRLTGICMQGDLNRAAECRARSTSEARNCGISPKEAQCTEAKENIDWVFRDSGAKASFADARRRAYSPLDAVIFAQRHNAHAQQTIEECANWAASYLETVAGATVSASNKVNLSNKPLGARDCRCVSVVPTNDVDFSGRRAYRVTNSCDGLLVGVQFIEKYPSNSMTSWAEIGALGSNDEIIVRAPAYKLTSIRAVSIRNVAGSFTCMME